MAWTNVRTERGSFVSPAAATSPDDPGANLFNGGLAGAEMYLAAFVAVQVLQFGLLWQGGLFDPTLAICQSISLLAVAGLFAATRAASTARQSSLTALRDAPVHPTASDDLSFAPTAAVTPAMCAIQIDEHSQTWADLMARISHEIRTPLNAVIGFSDLMEREIFGPLGNDRYRDYLAHIRDSGEALLRSAEDTLALSSMLAVSAPDQRVQSSSLLALAHDAWLFVEPQASRRGITLAIAIPDTLDVAGDRRAFRQALSNLMIEAVVRADDERRIEIKAVAHGDTVRVKVAAPHAQTNCRPSQPSLPVCVARALLELQGTSLQTEACDVRRRWQATTMLDLAVQPDFFG